MDSIRRMLEIIRNQGCVFLFRKIIYKAIGIDKYDERINTMHYFINNYIDITALKPAQGALRDLQLCDLELLKIFDEVCRENGWQYWLDYGTLLGAVRHKGFIPWDDDMDVAMPRKMYEKAVASIPEIMKRYGIEACEDKNEKMVRIGIGYKHSKTGIWLDVFPVDECTRDQSIEECYELLMEKVKRYRKFYNKNKNLDRQSLAMQKSQLMNSSGEHVIVYHGPEFVYPKMVMHDYDMVYPLSEIKFEGCSFPAPNNTHEYLKRIYGNNYMSFPQTGVEHHGGDNGKLQSWASKNNIDMNDILRELQVKSKQDKV